MRVLNKVLGFFLQPPTEDTIFIHRTVLVRMLNIEKTQLKTQILKISYDS